MAGDESWHTQERLKVYAVSRLASYFATSEAFLKLVRMCHVVARAQTPQVATKLARVVKVRPRLPCGRRKRATRGPEVARRRSTPFVSGFSFKVQALKLGRVASMLVSLPRRLFLRPVRRREALRC